MQNGNVIRVRSIWSRTLDAIAPGWQLRRESQRTRLEMLRKANEKRRAYEAAKDSRLRKTRRSTGSGDVAASNSLSAMREKARWLDENFDLVTGALNMLCAKVVGAQGLRIRSAARHPDGRPFPEFAQALERALLPWEQAPEATGELDFALVQQLALLSALRDGEVFCHHLEGRIRGFEHASPVTYALELLESDMVPHGPGGLVGLPTDAPDGIRRDRWGRALEYFVFESHPGDAFPMGRGLPRLIVTPAREISHFKFVRRIRQTRGISILASCINTFSDLEEYETAEAVAAKMAAYIVMSVKKSVDNDSTTTSDTSPAELDFTPGMMFDQLAPGDELQIHNWQRPNNQLPAYRQAMLRRAAAGMGLGYSVLSNEFEGSFSSRRTESTEMDLRYQFVRGIFVARFLRHVHRRRVAAVVRAGMIDEAMLREVDPASIYDADYQGPGVAYVDPDSESAADERLVRAGILSREAVQVRRGVDPERMRRELVRERLQDEKDGLVLSSNAAHELASTEAIADSDADKTEDTERRGRRRALIRRMNGDARHAAH